MYIHRIKLTHLFFAVSIVPSLQCHLHVVSAQEHDDMHHNRVRHHRKPNDSIAQQLQDEHSVGNFHPILTLHAAQAVVPTDNGDLIDTEEFIIHVREPIQAVTSSTIIRRQHNDKKPTKSRSVGNTYAILSSTILVADVEKEEVGTIALIAVNKQTGDVNGIVQKADGDEGRRSMKLSQKFGGKAYAYKAEEFIPPKWECKVDSLKQKQRQRQNNNTRKLGTDANNNHKTNKDADDNEREHPTHHHSHHHHHNDHQDDGIDNALKHIQDNLRGANIHIGDERKLQGSQSYNYQVDLYIEIDQAFVNLNEGVLEPNTVDYLNAIVTGANTIYETEIDTHLNIVAIDLNDNYDDLSDTEDAIYRMRDNYGGPMWHTPGIDLHHAILGNDMGGGIAFVGAICNSRGGFGVSASMKGSFLSMDSAAVWDMVVVMHEFGHNFASWHTFDTRGYDPPVDTCLSCDPLDPLECTLTCPAELPLAKSATIMSYCHFCDGGFGPNVGLENIDYTFGGKYLGSGDRADISSYDNSPLAGSINHESRRVNVVMFDHVSTRGMCTQVSAPQSPPPSPPPTPNPTTCKGMILTVKLTTDTRPEETSWTLTHTGTTQVVQKSPVYTLSNTLHSDEYCISQEDLYEYTIYDEGGNGLCCAYGQGKYEVIRGSEMVASGGSFESMESAIFGPADIVTDQPTSKPTQMGQTPKPTSPNVAGGKAGKATGGPAKADKGAVKGRAKADKIDATIDVQNLDVVDLAIEEGVQSVVPSTDKAEDVES